MCNQCLNKLKCLSLDVVGSTSSGLDFSNNNLVCNLAHLGRVNIDVVGREQLLDGTRVRAQNCTLHAVDLLAHPVDEAELDGDRLVNLFSESQQTVADVLVLQVADKLVQTTRALSTVLVKERTKGQLARVTLTEPTSTRVLDLGAS